MPFDGSSYSTNTLSVSTVLRRTLSFLRKAPQDTPETDLLRQARSLIADPDHWTAGAYQKGQRYCAMGAMHRARLILNTPASVTWNAENILHITAQSLGAVGVERYNDTHTHTQVMLLFDKAIGQSRR